MADYAPTVSGIIAGLVSGKTASPETLSLYSAENPDTPNPSLWCYAYRLDRYLVTLGPWLGVIVSRNVFLTAVHVIGTGASAASLNALAPYVNTATGVRVPITVASVSMIAGTDIAIVVTTTDMVAAGALAAQIPAANWKTTLHDSSDPIYMLQVHNDLWHGDGLPEVHLAGPAQEIEWTEPPVFWIYTATLGDYDAWVLPWVAGDSSSPVFLIFENEVVLLGLAWTAGGGDDLSYRISNINAESAKTGGAAVQTVDFTAAYDVSADPPPANYVYPPYYPPTYQEGQGMLNIFIGNHTAPTYATMADFVAAWNALEIDFGTNEVINLMIGTGSTDVTASIEPESGPQLAHWELVVTPVAPLTNANFDASASDNTRCTLVGTLTLMKPASDLTGQSVKYTIAPGFQIGTSAAIGRVALSAGNGVDEVEVTKALCGGINATTKSFIQVTYAQNTVVTVENIIVNCTNAFNANQAPIVLAKGTDNVVAAGTVVLSAISGYAPNATNGFFFVGTTGLGENQTLSISVTNVIAAGTDGSYKFWNLTSSGYAGLTIAGSGNRGGTLVPGSTDVGTGLVASDLFTDAPNFDMTLTNHTYNQAASAITAAGTDFLGEASPRETLAGNVVDVGALTANAVRTWFLNREDGTDNATCGKSSAFPLASLDYTMANITVTSGQTISMATADTLTTSCSIPAVMLHIGGILTMGTGGTLTLAAGAILFGPAGSASKPALGFHPWIT